jgi:O-antigen/teichoic acid export membrane protein
MWQGFLSIITAGIFAAIVYRTLPVADHGASFSLKALKNVQQFAMGMMMITFLAILLTQIDKVLLSRLLTLEAFGYYALAAAVANALYMLPGPVTAALYPRFAELLARADEPALITAYHKGAQLVSVFMGSAAIVLIVFGDIVMMLWTANPELSRQVAPLIAVLALGTLLNGLMWIPYQMQLAYGWTSLTVKINIIAVAVIVPAIFWVTPKYGAIGAAWVWVGLNTGYLTIAIYFIHRRLLPSEKWRWYIQDVAMPALGAIVVAIIARFFIPQELSGFIMFSTLLFVLALSSLASALVAPLVRRELLKRFALM